MKRPTTYVLFVNLLTSWTEGPYRWKGMAQETIKRIIAMTPHPPTHAWLRLEECEGRKKIRVIESWGVDEEGHWVQLESDNEKNPSAS